MVKKKMVVKVWNFTCEVKDYIRTGTELRGWEKNTFFLSSFLFSCLWDIVDWNEDVSLLTPIDPSFVCVNQIQWLSWGWGRHLSKIHTRPPSALYIYTVKVGKVQRGHSSGKLISLCQLCGCRAAALGHWVTFCADPWSIFLHFSFCWCCRVRRSEKGRNRIVCAAFFRAVQCNRLHQQTETPFNSLFVLGECSVCRFV